MKKLVFLCALVFGLAGINGTAHASNWSLSPTGSVDSTGSTQVAVDLIFNYTGDIPYDAVRYCDIDFEIDLAEVTPTMHMGDPKVVWDPAFGFGPLATMISGNTVSYAGGVHDFMYITTQGPTRVATMYFDLVAPIPGPLDGSDIDLLTQIGTVNKGMIDSYDNPHQYGGAIGPDYGDVPSVPCPSDLNGDGVVDGFDFIIFKGEYFKSECAPYIRLQITGQTTPRATGDDGDLEKGVPWPDPRFTDNDNGTVTDNLTNLVWLKDASCDGARSWANAVSDCNGLASGSCGLTDGSVAGDWRLPNVRELLSLINYAWEAPALPFPNPFITVMDSNVYWTSTTFNLTSDHAWRMGMFSGSTDVEPKTNTYYVWPVRDQ